jgi:hypothetical protein
MAVKLYRCSNSWVKGPHPCWQVQKALDEAGVEYEVVAGPYRRSKRDQMVELTGQRIYPAIQLENNDVVKKSSKELVEMIKAGDFL